MTAIRITLINRCLGGGGEFQLRLRKVWWISPPQRGWATLQVVSILWLEMSKRTEGSVVEGCIESPRVFLPV